MGSGQIFLLLKINQPGLLSKLAPRLFEFLTTKTVTVEGFETPKKRKAPKQSKMKMGGGKTMELYADHSSDMSTGISKKSVMKQSPRKSRRLIESFWDNDFHRDSKSKARKTLRQLFGHEKIYEGDSLIRL